MMMKYYQQKGFTLVELVMVMIVVGILVLVTITWPGRTVHLGADTQRLANDIRYVQFLAMSHNEVYRMHFSTGGSSYTITDGNNVDVPHPATNEATRVLEDGVTIDISSNLTNNYIAFNGLGEPYIDPATKLTSDATITLSGSGETNTITISPETGKVGMS